MQRPRYSRLDLVKIIGLSLLVAAIVAVLALFDFSPNEAPVAVPEAPVTVFAAASLTDALEEVAALHELRTRQQVRLSFAASSTLARQIEAGAPADLFLSASTQWVEMLASEGLVREEGMRDLLSNRLVIVATTPPGDDGPVRISNAEEWQAFLPGEGRIAVGDPAHVPAGVYAKTALEGLGVWTDVEARLAPASDVRAALALVERGEAPVGIVYATDSTAAEGVFEVAAFADALQPAIRYPVATIASGDAEAARAFIETLESDAAGRVFERFGFARP